jgi:hypothetical protein
MGVPYAPHPLPRSNASQTAIKKQKVEVSKVVPSRGMPSKAVSSLPKSGPAKKVDVLKIAHPKAKPGPRGMSEIELALAKPAGISKKFCLLDAVGSSHRPPTPGITTTHAARVPAFDNLGIDSSLDVC